MKSYFVILVASIVIAVQSIAPAEARYNRINGYLVSHVKDNDEIAPNMEALSTWLREEEAQKQSLLSTTPISDLKQLTALQQVLEDAKCDHTDYDIMRPVEESLDLHRMNEQDKIFRRIDKVILKIFREHADRCMKVYPAAYDAARERIDRTVFDRVAKMGEKAIASEISEGMHWTSDPDMSPEDLFNKYVKRPLTLGRLGDKYALREMLKSSAGDDPDAKYVGVVRDERTGKRMVHKDKIKELTKKYLIEPCRQYMDAMGPDVFIPARFDARVYIQVDDDLDYYEGWSYYRICNLLITHESALADGIARAALYF